MADKSSRRVAQTEDLSNVEFETSEDVEVIPTFDNMGLRDELLRGIYAYGMTLFARYIDKIITLTSNSPLAVYFLILDLISVRLQK